MYSKFVEAGKSHIECSLPVTKTNIPCSVQLFFNRYNYFRQCCTFRVVNGYKIMKHIENRCAIYMPDKIIVNL